MQKDVWKVSLRDMPYVISQNLYGATTVAATMRIAAMAGIKIFVTGGIGGVHRARNQYGYFGRPDGDGTNFCGCCISRRKEYP